MRAPIGVGTRDFNVDLVQVPAPKVKPVHVSDSRTAELPGEHWLEPMPPKPDGLTADIDTALEQQVFDVPERERVTDLRLAHKADHRGRTVKCRNVFVDLALPAAYEIILRRAMDSA